MGTKQEIKATAGIWTRITIWSIFGLALIVLLYYLGLTAWPALRDKWFSGWRSSNEYITTQQTLLIDLKLQYEKLDTKIAELDTSPQNDALVKSMRGQQIGIVDRMKQAASTIDDDQIPYEVRLFLSTK